VTKRGSNFYFWTGNVIGYSLIGQNHLCVKILFNRDSTIQKCFRRLCIVYKSEISIPYQLFGRRVIPSGRSSVHSSSRPDNVPYHPDARQTKASSKRRRFPFGHSSISRSFYSGRLSEIELQIFFSKANMGRLLQPSR
jgi:hypothetical protein